MQTVRESGTNFKGRTINTLRTHVRLFIVRRRIETCSHVAQCNREMRAQNLVWKSMKCRNNSKNSNKNNTVVTIMQCNYS